VADELIAGLHDNDAGKLQPGFGQMVRGRDVPLQIHGQYTRIENHAAMGRSILLFARGRVTDRAFWFPGPVEYVGHEGERPMAVTWRLTTPLSGDLYARFAAAIA
jgi:hypothetical protein